jgi:histidinol dehydrogenase
MKIKTLKLSDNNFYQSLKNALSFDEEDNSQIQQTVKDIVQAVKVNGDQALLEFTKKFDKVDLDNPSDLELPSSILKEAYDSLDTSTQNALNESAQRIKNYHEKQVQEA